jgi:thiol-disulfide isomerase/thioredoxin
MRQISYCVGLCVAVLLTALSLWAADETPPPPTVAAQYRGLSSGPLRQAKLVELPNGTRLRAGAMTIIEKQLTDEITRTPPGMQAQMKKYQFFLLEQLAIKALLVNEARAWAKMEKRDANEGDDAVIRPFLQELAGKATVSDDELQAFYEANKDMLGGVPFDAVKEDLRTYLLEDKRQEAVEAHINTLSERTSVEVDAVWLKACAAESLDNPVDAARRAGKPAMVDFGASGCGPCDMMEPLLKSLQESHAEQYTILYIDVREEQILAARYGVQGIPTQVFFDKDGEEVFRHVGFFSREQILAKLAETEAE